MKKGLEYAFSREKRALDVASLLAPAFAGALLVANHLTQTVMGRKVDQRLQIEAQS